MNGHLIIPAKLMHEEFYNDDDDDDWSHPFLFPLLLHINTIHIFLKSSTNDSVKWKLENVKKASSSNKNSAEVYQHRQHTTHPDDKKEDCKKRIKIHNAFNNNKNM